MSESPDAHLPTRTGALAVRADLVPVRVPPGAAGAGGLPVGARRPLLDRASAAGRDLDARLGPHRTRSGARPHHRLAELAHRLVVERDPRPRTGPHAPGPHRGHL